MSKKLGLAAVCLLLLVGVAYHFVFGYIATSVVDDRITLLQRKNILSQIGANIVIYEGVNETVVIDTQLKALASSMRSRIDSLVTTPVTQVIITHWHPDHSGGIASYSDDSKIYAQQNVIARLRQPQQGFGLTKPGSHHEFEARPNNELPTTAITNSLNLAVEPANLNITFHPTAHTDGDLVIIIPDSEVVVLGDLIWPESFPFIDVYNGGSLLGLERALDTLLSEVSPAYRFIPGHGDLMTYDEVTEYRDMVSQSRQWLESQLNEGKTVEQILSLGLPESWERWSSALVPSPEWINMIQGKPGSN